MQDTNIVVLSSDKGEKTFVMNSSDYNMTMMSMLCDFHTHEKMSPNIMDRVHPDIPRDVEKIVGQLTANNMAEMAQTIKKLVPQTPYAAKIYCIPKLHTSDSPKHGCDHPMSSSLVAKISTAKCRYILGCLSAK